jgi:hypothetical protein
MAGKMEMTMEMEIMMEMERGGYRDNYGNGDREMYRVMYRRMKYSNSAPHHCIDATMHITSLGNAV